jgi:lipopolysaccharide/colanic/teichoic acid biosynthesis glycosyltransferase
VAATHDCQVSTNVVPDPTDSPIERKSRPPTSGRRAKRGLDAFGAGVLLLLLAPVLLLSALLVLLEDGWPVMFRQVRVGHHGRSFKLLKLRTMRQHMLPVSVVGQVGSDHVLVLRTGRWLRRLKLDELPQLVNVLRGDMSLVGPRPTVPEQVAAYTPYQRRRLEVPAGMTGWAQVHGGVVLPWPDRILLDVWYIDHWSLALDLRILLRTMSVLFRGERADPATLAIARTHADHGGDHD